MRFGNISDTGKNHNKKKLKVFENENRKNDWYNQYF